MRILGVAALLAASVVFVSCSSSSSTSAAPPARAAQQQAIGGNIHPLAIQIDGPDAGPPGADLFADAGTPLNAGATRDWVEDSAPNAGTSCLGSDGIATCIQPNVTGATGGVGHWNGVRIVDGIAAGDQDIFTKGGKENEVETWDIDPGSVGSSKYDLVQAYLANNQSHLFFGMERSGNNGTTAFDFEFNQLAPRALPACPQLDNVPCRSVGDVLFTFEMQANGDKGSAVPFVFTWNGSAYVAASASGIFSSINDSATTKGGPWGHVDSHGDWVLGNLDRFTFAEASAPLSLLPGVNSCGGRAFVQVRTRSSSTVNSDLKDTSKIFEFVFLGLAGNATLTPSCDQGFNFAANGRDSNGQAVDGGCTWTFSDGTTSNQCSGFHAAAPGTYLGTVQIADPGNPGCNVGIDAGLIAAYPVISVTAAMTATCNNSFTYSAGVDGGVSPGAASVSWSFDGGGTVNPATSTTRTGTVNVGTPNVDYYGTVQVSETRDGGLTCTATGNASARPLAPLNIDLNLNTTVLECNALSSDAVTYGRSITGGNGTYIVTWDGGVSCAVDAGTCTIDPPDTTFCSTQGLSATVRDTSGLCPPATSEVENYSKVTTINASDNP